MSFRFLLAGLGLAGCTGLAWNTQLAEDPHVRAAMVASVIPGRTTDKEFETRWGKPTQIVHEGAQEAWVYRDMTNPPGTYALQYGDSAEYVIVDFQYGIAIGARSSEMVGCRGTFPPRPPGHHFDNPSTVHPVNCGSPGMAVTPSLIVAPAEPASPYPYLK